MNTVLYDKYHVINTRKFEVTGYVEKRKFHDQGYIIYSVTQ